MKTLLAALMLCLTTSPLQADLSGRFGEFLAKGDLIGAKAYLTSQATAGQDQKAAQMGLGVVEILQAVETLGQRQYRYGALSGSVRTIPILRVPVPANNSREEISYDDLRDTFEQFQQQIASAEETLASIDPSQEWKLRVDLSSIALDFDGDGAYGKGENFLTVFGNVNRRRGQSPEMKVAFDAGDVPWLRGYCHFLMGFCDVVLAYDHQRMFDVCAHLVYPKPKQSTNDSLPIVTGGDGNMVNSIADFIAAIHLCVLPVREAERMASARQHFLKMIETSRESWALILSETDDDAEWLPNPTQTGVLQMPVRQELIDGWLNVLTEAELVLNGDKLIPFWRDYTGILLGWNPKTPNEGRGVNLRRFFDEPRDFDLVLAIQGSGVLPYIEEGTLSTPETWQELRRVFGGNFFGFAVWFN